MLRWTILVLLLDYGSCLSLSPNSFLSDYPCLIDNQFCKLYDGSKISSAIPINVDAKDSSYTFYSIGMSSATGKLTASSHEKSKGKIVVPGANEQTFILGVNSSVKSAAATQTSSREINHADEYPSVGTCLLWSDYFVNIWEFRLEPRESCPFHVHRLPYLFINLRASLTQALLENGQPDGSPPRMQQELQITQVHMHELSGHGVRNVGSDTFEQVIVEFKNI